jgi:hypothetical protein
MEEKICPILTLGNTYVGGASQDHCVKEKCAWWVETYQGGKCAIAVLTIRLKEGY